MKITICVIMYCYNLKQKKLVIAPVVIKFNVSYFIGIRFTGRTPSPFAPLLLLVCNIQNCTWHDLISVTIIKTITTDLHFPLSGQSGAIPRLVSLLCLISQSGGVAYLHHKATRIGTTASVHNYCWPIMSRRETTSHIHSCKGSSRR